MENVYIKEPPYAKVCYGELIAPLAAKGRHDLVRGIERLLARYDTEERLKQREERLKQLDQKFLKGNALKFYKAVSLKGKDTL